MQPPGGQPWSSCCCHFDIDTFISDSVFPQVAYVVPLWSPVHGFTWVSGPDAFAQPARYVGAADGLSTAQRPPTGATCAQQARANGVQPIRLCGMGMLVYITSRPAELDRTSREEDHPACQGPAWHDRLSEQCEHAPPVLPV